MASTSKKQCKCCTCTNLYTLLEGQTKFSFELYDVLSGLEGNLVFSPLSLEVILSLACLGAKGATAQEIKNGLHLPDDNHSIESCFNKLLKGLKNNKNMILNIVNKIFVQEKFKIKAEFSLSANKFLAGVEEMDFQNKSEDCRKVINKWVEDKTNNIIKDLIPEGAIDSLTQLVLLNAIYFKGKWMFPFHEGATCAQDFHMSSTAKKDVQMMHLTQDFNYATIDELKAQVLEMPYMGDQLSMFILLPESIDGLRETMEKLKDFKFVDIQEKMYETEVIVSLPRFKLEQTLNLNDILVKLGMVSMFQCGIADFGGISDQGAGLVVSSVFQKAFIDLNEEGTEAAAATGVIVVKGLGGGIKHKYHWIDWKREGPKEGPPLVERVIQIMVDGCRTAHIALVGRDNKLRYILATENMKEGDLIKTSCEIPRIPVRANEGDAHPLGALPVGSIVNSVEKFPGQGSYYAHAAGSSCKILRHAGNRVIVQLPSKHEVSLPKECMATVGRLSNVLHGLTPIGSAQKLRELGYRPRSGLWHRKDGRFGRKIRKPPPIKVIEPTNPERAFTMRLSLSLA